MKKLWVVLAVVIMGLLGTVSVSGATGNERIWFFMDEKFENLSSGILTQDTAVDGLTLSKGIELKFNMNPKRIRGVEINKWIFTKDNGNTTNGYVKFYVNGNTNIHIFAGLDNNTGEAPARALAIYSEADGKQLTRISIKKIDDYVYEYRGGAGYIYLYTPDKYIRIFGIATKDYNTEEYAPLDDDEKKEWNFTSYKDMYNTIKTDMDIDGLKLYATEKYDMALKNSYVKSNYGTEANWYLDLKGAVKYNGRFVSFPVPRNSDIYITARSGDGVSERALMVRNTYFGLPDTDLEKYSGYSDYIEDTCVMVRGDMDTYKISYYGNGENFVLSSADSAIRIYKIAIVPRVNKVVDSKVWDISNNSKFTVGTYADAVIDGLEMYNSTVSQCNISDYTKRIHIKSGPYISASGKIRFNISDSSGNRGSNVKRTISITANTDSAGTMLVLVNSEDYLIGCVDLSTEIEEYSFEYTGNYEKINVYTYYPRNAHSANSYIYSINNGIAGTTGPDDTARTINVTKGQKYQYYFTAENVSPDKFTYKITYNPAALTVKYVGYGDGSNNYSKDGLNIINNNTSTGEITYTIDKAYEKWSGVTVSVIFEAKSTGNTTINYIAEIN